LPLYSEPTLAGIFGVDLAAEVMALPVGEWSAPIRSSYGYHLVLVREKEPSHAASLAEVRGRLLRDWRAAEREKAHDRALARLRAAYDVHVDQLGDA
jgi:parvulin-like peptidyl-prolyl isomerase